MSSHSKRVKHDPSGGLTSVFKDDDGNMVIWGPASVEIVDKENDLIRMEALEDALPQLLRRKRVSLEHTDQLVGDIIERFETDDPQDVTVNGETVTRSEFPTDILREDDGVPEAGLYVCTKLYDDTRQSVETQEKILSDEYDSYSISGESISATTKLENGELIDDISSLDLSAVTICEEGMNQKAGFDIVTKLDQSSSRSAPSRSVIKEHTESITMAGNSAGNPASLRDIEKRFRNAISEELPDGEIATKDEMESLVDSRLQSFKAENGEMAEDEGGMEEDEDEDEEDEDDDSIDAQYRKDEDPCWDGYEMIGMKTDENGNKVPDCVPKDTDKAKAFAKVQSMDNPQVQDAIQKIASSYPDMSASMVNDIVATAIEDTTKAKAYRAIKAMDDPEVQDAIEEIADSFPDMSVSEVRDVVSNAVEGADGDDEIIASEDGEHEEDEMDYEDDDDAEEKGDHEDDEDGYDYEDDEPEEDEKADHEEEHEDLPEEMREQMGEEEEKGEDEEGDEYDYEDDEDEEEKGDDMDYEDDEEERPEDLEVDEMPEAAEEEDTISAADLKSSLPEDLYEAVKSQMELSEEEEEVEVEVDADVDETEDDEEEMSQEIPPEMEDELGEKSVSKASGPGGDALTGTLEALNGGGGIEVDVNDPDWMDKQSDTGTNESGEVDADVDTLDAFYTKVNEK